MIRVFNFLLCTLVGLLGAGLVHSGYLVVGVFLMMFGNNLMLRLTAAIERTRADRLSRSNRLRQLALDLADIKRGSVR